jgi:hypothetical protein
MHRYESIKQQLATMIQDIANKEKGNISLESKIHMKKVKKELGEMRRQLILLHFEIEDIYNICEI